MIPHFSPLASILTWAGVVAYLAGTGFVIARGAWKDRRDDVREEHWQGVKTMLPDCAGDLPPSWDPLVTKNPRTPQRGEDHA